MTFVLPPMADEPPNDFIDFVAVRLADAQREAARLTGGPQHAEEIYPLALSDVAARWRRLRFRRRIERRDTAGEFLSRRLAARAKQWREDQIYDVEVQLLRDPVAPAVRYTSVAQLKASVLPGTVRLEARPVAEAGIAWVHAYRRYRHHVAARIIAGLVVYLVAINEVAHLLPS